VEVALICRGRYSTQMLIVVHGDTIPAAMTTNDRDQMMELCRRIHRETDPKRLAIYALELNQFIQRKLDELKSKAQ
jgi:hypothetical protein